MKITMYPAFDAVFGDQQVKGIFYPLCSVEVEDQYSTKLHFVSSNGTWSDPSSATLNNTSGYTLFDVVDQKYVFQGSVELYQGYDEIPSLYQALEEDFKSNGNFYLESKMKTQQYIERIQPLVRVDQPFKWDVEYYLEAFYEYHINKLNFELTQCFSGFRNIIDQWSSSNKKSPIVYPLQNKSGRRGSSLLQNLEVELPDNVVVDEYEIIGLVKAMEFFTDGNDTILLYNSQQNKVLCLNSYS